MFRMPKNAFFADGGAAASGALSGAMTGASVGASAGPWGAVIGGAVGAVGGGLMGAFGSNGKSESGLKLPPELEFKMLEDSFNSMNQVKNDYAKAESMYKAYEDRFTMLAQAAEANLPPEETRRALAKSSADIALNMGLSLQDAVKNGFLTQSDEEDLNSLKALESQDFRDPAYDASRVQQKQQLMQNLQRQGASPQQISQALTDFDNTSVLGAFSRSEELRQSRAGLISNRIGIRSGLQQQNFGMAQSAVGTQLGVLGQSSQQIQGAANLYGMASQSGSAGLQTSQALRGELQNQYNQLGEFKFSSKAKQYLALGAPQSGQTLTPDQVEVQYKQSMSDKVKDQLSPKNATIGAVTGGLSHLASIW